MCKQACSDILPRFRVTSCLRKFATPYLVGYDLLPSSETRPPAFGSSRHPAPPFRCQVVFRPHERPKGDHYP